MKWRWKSIKQFFNFYPSEKRGVLILMGTFFIVLIFSRYYRTHFADNSKIHLFEEVRLFHVYHFDTLDCIPIGHKFDTLTLQGRNMDRFMISKILKDQDKFGEFTCFSDFKDITAFTEVNFQLLSTHLSPDFFKGSTLDLNKSDERELVAFFRININKAKTFVKYRKSIGGFVKFEQINQIYGFPKKRLNPERIERLRLNKGQIVKFDLKKATYRNLLSHGMISRKSASRLNKLRKTRGLKLEDIQSEVSDFNKALVVYYFKE